MTQDRRRDDRDPLEQLVYPPAHPDLLEGARRQGKAIDDVDRQIQECKARLAEIDRLLGEG